MKKGFSLVTLLVTIFVIITLTSTVVISANSIYNNNKKVKFASEISYIKELVSNYISNNNGKLPSSSEVLISIENISKDDLNKQFAGESILEDTIFLNKIDMSMINPGTLQYGNGRDEKSDDIYCISKQTGKIYYIRGCNIGGKIYYTLTDELKKSIKYTESNNVNDGIIFYDGNLDNGIKEIDIKIPDSYLDVELTSTDVSFEYSSENQSGYNIYKTKSKENSIISVKYKVNNDSEKKELKYSVESVDNSELTFSLSDIKVMKNSETKKDEKYITIENLSKKDNQIKMKKYSNIYIDKTVAKDYFKNSGIDIKDNIISIDNSLGNVTVYVEDNSGNYHSEYITLNNNNTMDYINDGMILLLDGLQNTREGHSASTNVWEDLSGNNYDVTMENIQINNNNMYFSGTNSKMYSENNINAVSVEMVLELEETEQIAQYIAYFGSTDKILAWSPTKNAISLGHNKKRYSIDELYKLSSISVQYNPDAMYLNSKKLELNVGSESWMYSSQYPFMISGYSGGWRMKGKIYSIRVYNRALTQEEINHNYMVDKARYGIK